MIFIFVLKIFQTHLSFSLETLMLNLLKSIDMHLSHRVVGFWFWFWFSYSFSQSIHGLLLGYTQSWIQSVEIDGFGTGTFAGLCMYSSTESTKIKQNQVVDFDGLGEIWKGVYTFGIYLIT